MTRPAAIALLLLMLPAAPAMAHEARPAYLEITENEAGRFDVLWKTPVLAGRRLHVEPRFPEACRAVVPPQERALTGALVERSILACGTIGLRGQRVEFPGLQATITDVLVRTSFADGTISTTLVRPSRPYVDIAAAKGALQIARAYLAHGVQHILLGFDHLLFVLGLMLVVSGLGRLVKTVTAFTVAHSITLALATLGYVRVPGPPVEAAIALSILLLAVEIIRVRRGEPSFTSQRPWVVAFAFGLLHGFGFAGALAEVGLPQSDIPLALFAFNVGVEVGQLMFVAACLVLALLLRRARMAWPVWASAVPPYALGSLAAFWFFDRLTGFAP
jgi:hydrogenase/urease accessory protein HupE